MTHITELENGYKREYVKLSLDEYNDLKVLADKTEKELDRIVEEKWEDVSSIKIDLTLRHQFGGNDRILEHDIVKSCKLTSLSDDDRVTELVNSDTGKLLCEWMSDYYKDEYGTIDQIRVDNALLSQQNRKLSMYAILSYIVAGLLSLANIIALVINIFL